jgi:hypothetical protein
MNKIIFWIRIEEIGEQDDPATGFEGVSEIIGDVNACSKVFDTCDHFFEA